MCTFLVLCCVIVSLLLTAGDGGKGSYGHYGEPIRLTRSMGRLYGITDATVIVPLNDEGTQHVLKGSLMGGAKQSASAGAGSGADGVAVGVGTSSSSCSRAGLTDAVAKEEAKIGQNGEGSDVEGSDYDNDDFEPAHDPNTNSSSSSSSSSSSGDSSSAGNYNNGNNKDDTSIKKQGQENAVAALTPKGQIQWLLHRKRTIHRQQANLAEDALLSGLVSNQSSSLSTSSSSKHNYPGKRAACSSSPLLF